MRINRGYEIEKAMKDWFKGKYHPSNFVDFQTKTSLYEVKSCRLFNKCFNGNSKRAYIKKPHKKIITAQLGRFTVNSENHRRLGLCAKEENKIPKYIFVIVIGKQKIWRVKSWEQINSIVNEKKKINLIRIKDLFNEKQEEK